VDSAAAVAPQQQQQQQRQRCSGSRGGGGRQMCSKSDVQAALQGRYIVILGPQCWGPDAVPKLGADRCANNITKNIFAETLGLCCVRQSAAKTAA
jgi:hypothetical protein